MRGSVVIEAILDVLRGGAEASVALFELMASPSAGPRWKVVREMERRRRFGAEKAAAFRDRQRFYSLLSYLKQQGLVESKKEGTQSLWKITKKGLQKLNLLRERNRYSKESAAYPESKTETNLKIVAYDIPAGDGQKKRDWLRWALRNLGFTMLQKSVWVGRNKIPEEFLRDLRERKLLPYVQIFEVVKQGTLKEIT